MKKSLILVLFFLFFVLRLMAEITLPSLIASNMVLQQNSMVKFWGKATANVNIKIKADWSSKIFTTKSNKIGDWELSLSTPAAGGPYTISISDSKKLVLSNVLIGEVWLCSGQSNMEMPMKGYHSGQYVDDAQNTIAKATTDVPVRFVIVEKKNSLTPLENLSTTWCTNNAEDVKNLSATAYFFALYLQSVLKVPVGIISSSWGGSGIEAWMDSASLSKTRKVKISNDDLLIAPNHRHCQLYNGMIYPLRNYNIKGVLWYQGESNVSQYKLYKKEFPAMVAQWRQLWGIGAFPFYFAQIAPWKYDGIEKISSALFREMQQSSVVDVPNSEMVCTVDTGDSLNIHPHNKKMIAERFAFLALNKTYGKNGIEFQSPSFKSFEVINDTLIISFVNAIDGLHSSMKQISGFEIAGEDKVFKPAIAILTDKTTKIRLVESSVKHPIAARYAFKNYTTVSLCNNFGFPLMPFRTDNW